MNIKTTFTIIFSLCVISVNAQNVTTGLVAAYYFNHSATDSLINSALTTESGTFKSDVTVNFPEGGSQTFSRKPYRIKDKNNQANSAFNMQQVGIPNPNGQATYYNTTIDIPATNLLNAQYTYTLWIKATTPSEWAIILDVGLPPADQVVSLETDGTISLHSYYQSGLPPIGLSTVKTKGPLPQDQWTHVTAVRTLDSLILFTNGVKTSKVFVTTQTQAMYGGSGAKIGSRYNDGFGYYGAVDDVKIYNRALTAAEVLQEYNASNIITGIASSEEENSMVDLYPNPAQDVLHIDISRINEPLEYAKIIDLQGKELIHYIPATSASQFDIASNQLSKGYYVLQLKTAGKLYTRRFIK